MSKESVRPIFIFSLPRTGSTLVQRVLTANKRVSSVAEPHFLLPIVNMTKKEGMISYYSHQATLKGIEDFITCMPGGEENFYKRLHDFSIALYQDLSSEGSIYFLDKTPRYIYVIEEIGKIFPDAKFIFLFRNPIQIYASLMKTYCENNFYRMYRWRNFIHEGFHSLSEGYRALKDRALAVHYEDFLTAPKDELKRIYAYLELEDDFSVLESFVDIEFEGSSKDPTGMKAYDQVERAPLEKWKFTFDSWFRKQVLKRYIKLLREEDLATQGFDKSELLLEIKKHKTKKLYTRFSDLYDLIKAKLVLFFHLNLFFDRKLRWTRNQHLN